MAVSNFDAGRWLEDTAMIRIGPDTEALAEHIRNWHPRGCLCPECSELRAAVGRMAGRDKRIAKMMTAREAGKRAAEQGITAQKRREAAARAQVTRELAACGAYPYRFSGNKARLAPDKSAVIALEYWARREALTPDPVAQWWEVTRSLVLPDPGRSFAAIPDQPPGTCLSCRTGPLFAGTRCWYCDALDDLRLGQSRLDQPGRPQYAVSGRSPGLASALAVIAMTVAGCVLMSLAAAGYPALTIPGLVLLAAGVAEALSR